MPIARRANQLSQALSLLKQITPMLRSYKRRRAELALTHYEHLTARNGKYSAGQLAQRKHFEQLMLECSARDTANR